MALHMRHVLGLQVREQMGRVMLPALRAQYPRLCSVRDALLIAGLAASLDLRQLPGDLLSACCKGLRELRCINSEDTAEVRVLFCAVLGGTCAVHAVLCMLCCAWACTWHPDSPQDGLLR